MGYRVTSALTIGHGDGHVSFMYFVPSFRIGFSWISEWFDHHFDAIAFRIGPNAVIVSPFQQTLDQYRRELSQAIDWQNLGQQDVLSGECPFLVVSGRPLQVDSPAMVAVIDLSFADTPSVLARLMDDLASAIAMRENLVDDMPAILRRIPEFSKSSRVESAVEVVRMLELKPNFMGVGINLNAIVEWFRKRRQIS